MEKITQQILKWWPLPISVLSAIAWTGQTDPESATSNFSKWAKFIGINNLPSIPLNKGIVNYIVWTFLFCFILYILRYLLRSALNFLRKLKKNNSTLNETHQTKSTNIIAKAYVMKDESKTTPPPPSLTPEEPINFEILYAKEEDKDLIWLRFLPDTENQNQDAFMLILYGYKLIHGINDIPVSHINVSLRKSGCLSKDKKQTSLEMIMPLIRLLNSSVPTADEIVRELRYGYVGEKLNLSRGGTYRLTTIGEDHALRLAKDLIRRA